MIYIYILYTEDLVCNEWEDSLTIRVGHFIEVLKDWRVDRRQFEYILYFKVL